MKLLVPVYDLSLVDQALRSAKARPDHFGAIFNPENGPGRKKYGDWLKAIQSFQKTGCECYGYTDLQDEQGHAKSDSGLYLEVNRWQDWYGLNRYFYEMARSV